jgi:hypothetical protein
VAKFEIFVEENGGKRYPKIKDTVQPFVRFNDRLKRRYYYGGRR